jgi:hypothetical protein
MRLINTDIDLWQFSLTMIYETAKHDGDVMF